MCLSACAQGTAFTYQGRLSDANGLATGSYDLMFTLFGTNTDGSALAGPVTNTTTAVSNGLFTATIDFGGGFDGGARWLELAVSTNGANAFTTLVPRQPLTPAPMAVFANTASNISGTVSASQLSGNIPSTNISGVLPLTRLPAAVVTNGASGVNFSGTFSGNGGGLTNLNAAQLTSGTIPLDQLPSGVITNIILNLDGLTGAFEPSGNNRTLALTNFARGLKNLGVTNLTIYDINGNFISYVATNITTNLTVSTAPFSTDILTFSGAGDATYNVRFTWNGLCWTNSNGRAVGSSFISGNYYWVAMTSFVTNASSVAYYAQRTSGNPVADMDGINNPNIRWYSQTGTPPAPHGTFTTYSTNFTYQTNYTTIQTNTTYTGSGSNLTDIVKQNGKANISGQFNGLFSGIYAGNRMPKRLFVIGDSLSTTSQTNGYLSYGGYTNNAAPESSSTNFTPGTILYDWGGTLQVRLSWVNQLTNYIYKTSGNVIHLDTALSMSGMRMGSVVGGYEAYVAQRNIGADFANAGIIYGADGKTNIEVLDSIINAYYPSTTNDLGYIYNGVTNLVSVGNHSEFGGRNRGTAAGYGIITLLGIPGKTNSANISQELFPAGQTAYNSRSYLPPYALAQGTNSPSPMNYLYTNSPLLTGINSMGIVYAGGNDLVIVTNTAYVKFIYSNNVAACTLLKSWGFFPVVMVVYPPNFNITNDAVTDVTGANRNRYTNLLVLESMQRATPGDVADYVFDMAATNLPFLDLTSLPDGTHPSTLNAGRQATNFVKSLGWDGLLPPVNYSTSSTTGFSSLATNTAVMGLTGWTNDFGVNARIFGFVGTSVVQTFLDGTSVDCGSFTAPISILLQPNESIVGTGCSAIYIRAF